MNCSTVQLVDLPDEMLIEILKKLTNVDVLYSMLGVSQRFDRLARDAIFTHFLDLTTNTTIGERRHSMSKTLLDRFCSFILPQIYNDIRFLALESLSMKRILVACDYPQLHKLKLRSIEPKVFINYLADDSSIVHIFKQITHLEISTIGYYSTESEILLNTNGYGRLFSVCQRLSHLNISGNYFRLNQPVHQYDLPLSICSSSTITALNIKVRTIDDCLCLLGGRFNQMKTLIIDIKSIEDSILNIDNKSNLPNLTTFFLSSLSPTEEYDNLIVPMLRRMSNIQKLGLYLQVENRPEFIDGTDLYNGILIYMPRIQIFFFNITTIDDYVDKIYWYKNDDIEDTDIIDYNHPDIDCRIDYFTNGCSRCRISSKLFIKSSQLYND
ncbi:unnamed protein product [Rotaria magnacalcarata]|uniref:F-box domain-containing protein n=1 Tax=Rotaria magnacalcarata TaxID=392030 RepID=A0A814N564_9BILA|nr:unnamed protein product [Rotaria magnacalcarata]CAF1390039.1 unnamed protein product [Rotaria magnacalcarata]CAF2268323.1 unnamed protein product [Rotaria magnacalcarata]CAF3882226.1 unnamed protein product [Rotaria magnacalcarata]CAF3914050.1 unnamed protein product [Rotaria magnacalcarata]